MDRRPIALLSTTNQGSHSFFSLPTGIQDNVPGYSFTTSISVERGACDAALHVSCENRSTLSYYCTITIKFQIPEVFLSQQFPNLYRESNHFFSEKSHLIRLPEDLRKDFAIKPFIKSARVRLEIAVDR
jgi:hypothetical protein